MESIKLFYLFKKVNESNELLKHIPKVNMNIRVTFYKNEHFDKHEFFYEIDVLLDCINEYLEKKMTLKELEELDIKVGDLIELSEMLKIRIEIFKESDR